MKALENLTVLNHEVQLFIPSIINVQNDIGSKEIDACISLIQKELAEMFGEFTTYDATGGWVSDYYGLFEQPMTIVTSNISESNFTNENISKVIQMAELIKERMIQEAVSLKVDGKLYLV